MSDLRDGRVARDGVGWVEINRQRHDDVAPVYDTRHPEIHNPTEQRRLQWALSNAVAGVLTANLRSLDFGCGTGNLTGKLLTSGREVWAADVSPGMLQRLVAKHPGEARSGRLRTELLSGELPLPFPDGHFGLATSYSVLHHVPDYLGAVRELGRVVARGGILFIDHEHNEEHWRSPVGVRLHRLLTMPSYSLGRIWARVRSLFGHREPPLPPPGQRPIPEEGDIHIYKDDCIDWPRIRGMLADQGFEELVFLDYLLCRETARVPLRHLLCRWFATDTSLYIGRKR